MFKTNFYEHNKILCGAQKNFGYHCHRMRPVATDLWRTPRADKLIAKTFEDFAKLLAASHNREGQTINESLQSFQQELDERLKKMTVVVNLQFAKILSPLTFSPPCYSSVGDITATNLMQYILHKIHHIIYVVHKYITLPLCFFGEFSVIDRMFSNDRKKLSHFDHDAFFRYAKKYPKRKNNEVSKLFRANDQNVTTRKNSPGTRKSRDRWVSAMFELKYKSRYKIVFIRARDQMLRNHRSMTQFRTSDVTFSPYTIQPRTLEASNWIVRQKADLTNYKIPTVPDTSFIKLSL